MKNWRHSDVWKMDKYGITMEIIHWSMYTIEQLNNDRYSRTSWNYYAYLLETVLGAEKFEPLWLKDNNDYFNLNLGESKWNGGLTFYDKGINRHSNKRWVKVGCDFSHYWDYEREEYSEDEIKGYAEDCLNKLVNFFELKKGN